MTWESSFRWHLSQVAPLLAHLRDSMVPLAAGSLDARVSGTREVPLPFRSEPMDDADRLWSKLVWYGSTVAQSLRSDDAPGVLTRPWLDAQGNIRIYPGEDWRDTGNLAAAVTRWLIEHAEDVERIADDISGEEFDLFDDIRRTLARYRFHPVRLRTSASVCVLCGAVAVRAEWNANRRGDVDVTVQCTRCGERYDPRETRMEQTSD